MYDILDTESEILLRPTYNIPKPDENDNYHVTYCIINKLNQKYYIGKHTTKNLNDDYYGSGTLINDSVSYHGKDNFYKFIINYHSSSEKAYSHEEFLITKQMLISENCYNCIPGGNSIGNADSSIANWLRAACRKLIDHRYHERSEYNTLFSISRRKVITKSSYHQVWEIFLKDMSEGYRNFEVLHLLDLCRCRYMKIGYYSDKSYPISPLHMKEDYSWLRK